MPSIFSATLFSSSCESPLLGAHSERMMAIEALAILARRDPDDAQEGPSHRLGGAEAGHRADRLEAFRGLLEEPTRRLDADGGHEARRGRAHLTREDTREVARAHGH